MRISRTPAVAFVLLALALIIGLGGCAGQVRSGSPPAQAQVAQTAQPADKPAQPVKDDTPVDSKNLNVPKPELGATPAEAKTTGDGKKVVYLTFDDGPNSDFTGKVLDILKEKDVKATFMVVGRNAARNPAIIKRILAEGNGLGNHTYSHDYNIIYKSPEAFIADLDKTNQILLPYTGKPLKIFRAPGGPQKLSNSYKEKLHSLGYISVGWNITSADSDPHGVTPEQEYNNVVKDLARVERLKLTPIVLMHDGTQLATTVAKPGTPLAAYVENRESTIKALPAVIDLFKEKGYRFALVDENTPPAW